MTIWRILPPNFKSFDWSFWPLYFLCTWYDCSQIRLGWRGTWHHTMIPFTRHLERHGHVKWPDVIPIWKMGIPAYWTDDGKNNTKKNSKKRQQEGWTSTFKRDLPGDFRVEHYFLSSQIRTWVGIGWIPNLNSHSVGSHWQTIVEWDVQSNPSY